MYEDLLPLVEKPSRYLGNEIGAVRVDPAAADVHWVISYPDLYEVGSSNTGLPILYFLLNSIDDVACERVFLPARDMQKLLLERERALLSLETRRPIRAFDVFGIQLPHEMCYTNLVLLCQLSGIAVRSRDRREEDPIVLGGGPGAFAPEPVAELFDAILVGDGEDAVVEISDCIRLAKADGVDRTELLDRLAEIEGVYVPSHFEVDYHEDGRVAQIRSLRPARTTVRKALIDDLETAFYPETAIVPYADTIHNRLGVEIMRGCTVGCRFCQAGMIYRPLRERSPGKILQLADRGLCATGFEDVSLLSLDTGDYTMIDGLAQSMIGMTEQRRISTSLPSLRAGSLTDRTIAEIKKVRQTSFTIAPEAGTQRLRDVINKNISQDEVWETVERVARQGWRAIKFYFMCGLPTETDEDLEGIVEMAIQAREIAQRHIGRFKVTVSLGAHVPKPHTPFQWEDQMGPEEARRRMDFVRSRCRPKGIDFKGWDPEISWLEGVFSRGDRRLFDAVLEATRRGGGFEAWQDHFDVGLWRGVFRDLGIDPMWYHRRRDWDEVLPWDHIDSRVTKKFLAKDAKKVTRELRDPSRSDLRTTADCRDDQCAGCAVCFEGDIRNRLAKYGEHPFAEAPASAVAVLGGAPSLAIGRFGGRRLPMIASQVEAEPAEPVAIPENRKWQTKPGAPGGSGPATGFVEALRRGEETTRPRVASIAEGRRVEAAEKAAAEAIEWPAQATPDEMRALLAVANDAGPNDAGPDDAGPDDDHPEIAGDDEAKAAVVEVTPRFGYRVTWTKTGTLRHLAHREIINIFYRALHRARLPVEFTSGYHPKPKMAFGPGLPVSVESVCEEADIFLVEDLAPEAVLERLHEELPSEQGLAPTGIRRLEPGETSVQASLGIQRYALRFESLGGRDSEDGRARLRAALGAFLATESLPMERKAKRGKRQTVDVRPLVVEAVLEEPAGDREQGVLGYPPVLHVATRIGERGQAVRPRELIEILAGEDRETAEGVRVLKLTAHDEAGLGAERVAGLPAEAFS